MSYEAGERQAKAEIPQVDKKLAMDEAGYEDLARILERAYHQSATGKGRARHANNQPFKDQPIMEIGRMSGIGGHVYQMMKKAQEAGNMFRRSELEAAIAEFYGVIVYAAAAVLLAEEQLQKETNQQEQINTLLKDWDAETEGKPSEEKPVWVGSGKY